MASSGPLLLLVEDDVDHRELYQLFLGSRGFRVVAATSGIDALALLEDLRPALIVLDVGLPGLDGIEVTRRIKANERTRAIPIVIVSASVFGRHEQAAREAGADAFVRKPCTPSELLAVIRDTMARALRSRRTRECIAALASLAPEGLVGMVRSLAMGAEEPGSSRICATCGASDWGTRNRCNPCRARRAREAWANDREVSRDEDRERHRAWRRANPEKSRAQDRRQSYGIDTAQFEAMLAAQGRRCAICRAAEPKCVDHCHATGAIRSILCRRCNAGLAQFGDDPKLLRAAARYVERHRKAALP